MALDASIPLQVRGPQLDSPQNILANAIKLKSAQLGLDQQQQGASEKNALAAVLRDPSSFDASGNLSRAAIPRVAQASPTSVPAYSQLINQQDTATAAQGKATMDAARQHVQLQAQILGTVTDDASYQRAKQMYAQYGGDVNQLPPTYDPNWVAQAKQGALTAAEQFDQQYKMHTQQNDDTRLDLARSQQQYTQANPQLTPLDTANGPVVVNNRTGAAQSVTMGGAPLPPKNGTMNDSQSKANLFGTRAAEADRILEDMSQQGVDRPSTVKGIAEAVPYVGDALGTMVNAASGLNKVPGVGQLTSLVTPSPKQQQVEQAQRDFVNAVLRRESGAAIAPSEFDNAKKQYFPAIGDSPEVIAQKAANRRLAVQGIQAEVPAAFRGNSPGAPAGRPSLKDIFGN
jgi:hypothetical protein